MTREEHANLRFNVEIDGLPVSGFVHVELPAISAPPILVREGSDPSLAPRKVPGAVEFGELVLVRRYDGNHDLATWMRAVASGENDRRSVAVRIFNRRGEEFAVWLIRNAWPTRYEGPSLDGRGNEAAMETITLACESVRIEP